jgi:hypothetical protein
MEDTMKRRIASSPCGKRSRTRTKLVLSLLPILVALLALTQANCVLITETIVLDYGYYEYKCKATLIDSTTGESRIVMSSTLDRTAPGAPARHFFDYDWDGNGTRSDADVRLDWRRYLANSVITSPSFTGRSWCIRPSQTSCVRSSAVIYGARPSLPDRELVDCEGPIEVLPRLEVTALYLTPDNQFSFPDTPVGDLSAPVTFTVTNPSTVPLRVIGADLLASTDAPDFVKSADTCQPTPAELALGRGRLLDVGRSCTFQLQFRPQHRDGVAECAGSAPNESCRRHASLQVTGQTDTSARALAPVNVVTSGRAIGGGIVTEPGEICFSTAPALGSCTATQTLRIRNTSTGDLTLTSARLTRAGNRFDAPMPFLMPFPLPGGLYIDVPVRFCNVANDPTDGEFTINSSAPSNPTTVVRLVNPLNRLCP